MYAQVLNFTINPDSKAGIDELVKAWTEGPGKNLPGCERITILEETGGLNRAAITVYFRDKPALDHFSEHSESLALFDKAKVLLPGVPSFYEATVKHVDLSK